MHSYVQQSLSTTPEPIKISSPQKKLGEGYLECRAHSLCTLSILEKLCGWSKAFLRSYERKELVVGVSVDLESTLGQVNNFQ